MNSNYSASLPTHMLRVNNCFQRRCFGNTNAGRKNLSLLQMKLSSRHKGKLVGGLIGILLLALSLLVKNFFSKEEHQYSDTHNISSDTNKQAELQVSQSNKNVGTVHNEFITGD